MRESSSIPIIKKLLDKGIQLQYHDPYIRKFELDGATLESVSLTKRNIQRHDGVLILTDHSSISYESLATIANLIIDTRNATKGIQDRSNIVLI
ncbi:UDP-N-acetyl-D-glucosamine 6-dehydrogenase [compost metagenome]